jgi:hypothetical protein
MMNVKKTKFRTNIKLVSLYLVVPSPVFLYATFSIDTATVRNVAELSGDTVTAVWLPSDAAAL